MLLNIYCATTNNARININKLYLKMFENLGRAGYIIILILIIGAAFLSQQQYAREYGKNIYSDIIVQKDVYWARLSNWLAPGTQKDSSGTGVKEASGGEAAADSGNNQNENNIFENNFLK